MVRCQQRAFFICKTKNAMTDQQPGDTPRPNHSTGPKTPEGKQRCRLNAYRHGLTGQLCIFTPEEQQAYDKHSKIVLEAFAPVGDFERGIAQSIAHGHWRLKRAGAIEDSSFALGAHEHSVGDTGHAEVNNAFAQARTWREQAHNLHLLTVYEQRIQRSIDKNTAHLKELQTERKKAAQEAMEQAKLLSRLAQAEGKSFQPKTFFITAPEVMESVFSSTEVAREVSRAKQIKDAEDYHYFDRLPENDEPEEHTEASAG